MLGPTDPTSEKCSMLDAIVLAIGLGFFVLSILYGMACDRL
jgi:hypothetical protein